MFKSTLAIELHDIYIYTYGSTPYIFLQYISLILRVQKSIKIRENQKKQQKDHFGGLYYLVWRKENEKKKSKLNKCLLIWPVGYDNITFNEQIKRQYFKETDN